MSSSIKAKTAIGIGGLFGLLLAISVVSFIFINILSSKTENLLTANYKTIQYCNQMMHAMDVVHLDKSAIDSFEKNLRMQESNITESGEAAATQRLRYYFEQVKKNVYDTAQIDSVNKQLYDISMLNQHALERKNNKALITAQKAKMWISVLGAVIILIGFTFAVNFPGYISTPIRQLTDGITEIARKNYKKRIYLNSKDEFGEMAAAFNSMAEKLYEFENSSISKLMFEKKRIDTIINQMRDAVTGLDTDGKILFMNHVAEELFNLKANDIIGKYAPDVALYNDLLRTVMQKNYSPQPLKIIVDGKENYFSIENRVVFNDDVMIGEVFTLKNITSFKELDISKTNLLATISHELKTPISSIKMSTRLVSNASVGKLNKEQAELIKDIEEDADRLLKITGELLNATQIETGNIQLKLQKVDANIIITSALEAVQTQAEQKNILIESSYSQTVPLILADPDKTSWVLINFLTNAIKYSAPGRHIIIALKENNNMVYCSVQDFGTGIEAKYLSRIFDRYFKVPGSADKSSTGLGLAISKEFIEAQGGSISVQSQPGVGSTFTIGLPLAK